MSQNGNGSSTPQVLVEAIARQMGQDAFEKAKDQATEVIAWEKLRRDKQNESEIKALKVRYGCCFERRKELKDTLRLAPTGNLVSLQGRRWFCVSLAMLLVVAGIFFAHLTLVPFGLGWEAWLFSAGLGLVAAFWTERTLEKINSEALIRSVCVIALLGSLGGLLVMALLRGDILALYLQSSLSDGTTQLQNASSATEFYRHAIPRLQLLMALLAISMELGSGMAIFEARKLDLTSYERAALKQTELLGVEEEMISIIGRVTHLENDSAINEAQFYRDFYLGMLERIKRNTVLHLLVMVGVMSSLGFGPSVRAQNKTGAVPVSSDVTEVIAVDFTQSVAGKGYDGTSNYEKNIDGACRTIELLPPGSHLTVIAITDRSFSEPYVLLERQIPRDKGSLEFVDRVANARRNASAELRRVTQSSPPKFPRTDILGALAVSADLLRTSHGRKVLVIFSDMRQSTQDLDVEHTNNIAARVALQNAEKQNLVADLQGTEVYVFGVDGKAKSMLYWDHLRDFWAGYFERAGGILKKYSMLRDASDLAGAE